MGSLSQKIVEDGRYVGLDGYWHLYPDCHGTIPQALVTDDEELEFVFWIDPDVEGACLDCIKRWKEEVSAKRQPLRASRLQAIPSV